MEERVIQDLLQRCFYRDDVENTVKRYLYWHLKKNDNTEEDRKKYIKGLINATEKELSEVVNVHYEKRNNNNLIHSEMIKIQGEIIKIKSDLENLQFDKEEKLKYYILEGLSVFIPSIGLHTMIQGSNFLTILLFMSGSYYAAQKLPNKILPDYKKMMMDNKASELELKLNALKSELIFKQNIYELNVVKYDLDSLKINVAIIIKNELEYLLEYDEELETNLINIQEFQKIKHLERTFKKL